ncbi:hypothetical protein VE03_10458, partial [Pseudogymnoascus sp. 23342-1-I1]
MNKKGVMKPKEVIKSKAPETTSMQDGQTFYAVAHGKQPVKRSGKLKDSLMLVISDSELVLRQKVLFKIGKNLLLMYGGER